MCVYVHNTYIYLDPEWSRYMFTTGIHIPGLNMLIQQVYIYIHTYHVSSNTDIWYIHSAYIPKTNQNISIAHACSSV